MKQRINHYLFPMTRPMDWRWRLVIRYSRTPYYFHLHKAHFDRSIRLASIVFRVLKKCSSRSPNQLDQIDQVLQQKTITLREKNLLKRHSALVSAIIFGRAARNLKRPESVAADMIIARILAEQCFSEIAETTGLSSETIEWYEILFCDFRSHLSNTELIVGWVLHPAFEREHRRKQLCPSRTPELFHIPSLMFAAYYLGRDCFLELIGVGRREKRNTEQNLLQKTLIQHSLRIVCAEDLSLSSLIRLTNKIHKQMAAALTYMEN